MTIQYRQRLILDQQVSYFLLRLRLLEPPVESKREASRVAGFLEARNAEIRRYFAAVDMWRSISSEDSQAPNFLAFPFCQVSPLLAEVPEDGWGMTLNISFRDSAIYG